jgi:hypothetical protein
MFRHRHAECTVHVSAKGNIRSEIEDERTRPAQDASSQFHSFLPHGWPGDPENKELGEGETRPGAGQQRETHEEQ